MGLAIYYKLEFNNEETKQKLIKAIGTNNKIIEPPDVPFIFVETMTPNLLGHIRQLKIHHSVVSKNVVDMSFQQHKK